MKQLKYIDLFAGAGGLSEGFIRAGFHPIAHVEMNKDACDTLKTRAAYHWLKENGKENIYYDYLKCEAKNKEELWEKIPGRSFPDYYFFERGRAAAFKRIKD